MWPCCVRSRSPSSRRFRGCAASASSRVAVDEDGAGQLVAVEGVVQVGFVDGRALVGERDGESGVPDFADAADSSGCGREHGGGFGRVPFQDRADRLDVLGVKVWTSGPSMLAQVVGGSSPSRPGPATRSRTGALTWQHAASVRASASGLLRVGSSPRARMSPPTSRRSIDSGARWLMSSSSWRVMPSAPWCGSIRAKVCGSSAASRGSVEPAGAIGRASAGTAQTLG